ncbi:unnamed protein product [Malus baccata var. baccata]
MILPVIQGFIYHVVKSSVVLVEFEDDFYVHHYSTRKYDVSFSFNSLNFIFPESVSRTNIPTAPALVCPGHKLDANQLSAVRHILSIRGSPPYLLVGQLCVKKSGSPPYLLLGQFWDEKTNFRLSRTGVVVSEAVHQLCQTSHGNRILVCAPSNLCCDGLMRSLLKWIPESDMFRVNTAFREKEEVPEDILPSCFYKETYTSLVLRRRNFDILVIFFLVDASSAIEPETLVKKKGLKISLFERLSKSVPYCVEASVQCSSHNWSIITSK